MTNEFTMQNTNFIYSQEELDKMNQELLELYPQAFTEDADDQLIKHYSEVVLNRH